MKALTLAAAFALASVCISTAKADPIAVTTRPAPALAQETPAKFIKQVIEGNLAEIQAGQLAEKQASSADVKSLAQQLVSDHQAANDEATALAKQSGIPVPAQVGKREQAMLAKLEKEAEEFKQTEDYEVRGQCVSVPCEAT